LDLFGSFRRPDAPISLILENEGFVHEIWGNTENSGPCTLLNCHSQAGPIPSNVERSRLGATSASFGSLFYRDRPNLINAVQIECNSLPGWFPFRSFHNKQTGKPGLYAVPEACDYPKFSVRIESRNFNISIELPGQFSVGCGHYQIDQAPALLVRFDSPQPLETAYGTARDLSNLMTILSGTPNYLSKISIQLELDESVPERFREYANATVFPNHVRRGTGDTSSQWEMPFSYSALKDRNATIFQKWFHLMDSASPVADLFFDQLFSLEMDESIRFLLLMQSIEALHRRSGSDHYLPDTDFSIVRDVLISAIPDDIPSQLRQSIKSRIKFGNEISLRSRLLQIFRGLSNNLRDHFSDGEKPQILVNRLVDARNHLTHYPTDASSTRAASTNFFLERHRLQGLMYALLLQEVGFSASELEGLLTHQFGVGDFLSSFRRIKPC
jgi:hypothetical protein